MASHSSEVGSWLDRVLGAAAALVLFCLMSLTTVDVIGRYFFNRPLRGAFEITELLLLTLIFAAIFFWFVLAYYREIVETDELSFTMITVPLKYVYWIGPIGALQFLLTAAVLLIRFYEEPLAVATD